MGTPLITPDEIKRLQNSGVLPPNPFDRLASSSPLSTSIAAPRSFGMSIPGPILGQPSVLGGDQNPLLRSSSPLKSSISSGDGSLQRLPVPDLSGYSTPSFGSTRNPLLSTNAPLPTSRLGMSVLSPPASSAAGLQRLPTTLEGSDGQMPGPAAPSKIQTQFDQDQNRLNFLRNSGTGISQIGKNVDSLGNKTDAHPGFWKTLGKVGATIGDDALAVLAPNVERLVPGGIGHHQDLLGQQKGAVTSDQDQMQKSALLDETQAHAQQQQALAQQEQARSRALLNPKPNAGELLYDKNGSPLGFRDGQGNYMASDDPALPHGVRDILSAASRKNPTNAFELWQSQNPKGSAEDYLKLSGENKVKPLEQQLLEAETAGDEGTAKTIRNVIRETRVQPRIDVHNATAPSSGLPSGSSTNPMVQAIIEGRAPAPTTRSKASMALMAAVTAADPSFDASRYGTYQAMQQEMTKGKTGAAINSLNTIQEHIERAFKNMPDNTGNAAVNWIKNSSEEAFGKNPTGKFEVDATGIAGEWGKLVAGGVASEGEQKHVQALLSPNASPQKMRDNLAEVKAMTDGKLAGIQRQIESARPPWMNSNPASSLPSRSDATQRPANVPAGFLSITDSQGSQHWIPPQSLGAAKQRDPGLRVSQ